MIQLYAPDSSGYICIPGQRLNVDKSPPITSLKYKEADSWMTSWRHDHVYDLLVESLASLGPVFISNAGVTQPSHNIPLVPSYRPINRNYDPVEDARNYTNTFSNLFLLRGMSRAQVSNEKPVYHVSSKGSLVSTRPLVFRYADRTNFGAWNFTTGFVKPANRSEQSQYLKGLSPIDLGVYGNNYPFTLTELVKELKRIFDSATPNAYFYYDDFSVPNGTAYPHVFYGGVTKLSFSYKLDGFGRVYEVSYKYFSQERFFSGSPTGYESGGVKNYWYWTEYDVSHTIGYPTNPFFVPGQFSVPGVSITTSFVYTAKRKIIPTSPTWTLLSSGTSSVRRQDSSGLAVLMSEVSASPTVDDVSKFTKSLDGRTYKSEEHGRAVDHEMVHLRPLSFYCAQGAIDEYTQVISTNLIEFLYEIDGLITMLPQVVELLTSAVKLVTSKGVSALKEFVDIITSAKLLYEFGIRPSVDSIVELTTAQKAVKRAFEKARLSTFATYYGKRNYDLPEPLVPWASLTTVEVRTKINLCVAPDTIVAQVLPAMELGFFPSLSRLWDIFPLSFFIDWFTNQGERLKAIDDQFRVFAYDFNYLMHSYKVTSFVSDAHLATCNMASPSTQKPSFVVYRRELTRYAPMILPSKYDFLAPTGGQDIGTVGAVFYKLLS